MLKIPFKRYKFINNININPVIEFVVFLILSSNTLKHNNYVYVNILLTYGLLLVLYSYGHNYYNISIYYQTINYLNSKNNTVVVFLFIVLTLLNKKKTINNVYFFFFFFISYIYFSTEINQQYTHIINSKNNLNINLINGIMLVHPYILYIFYALFINLILLMFINLIFLKSSLACVIGYKKRNLIKIFLIIYTSIILGCLWAEQELSWGGWWSWDFVELLALNYLIFFLYELHNNYKNLKNFSNYIFGFFLFFLAVLTVRFNIINSIHNFINVESQNQYYYYVIFLISSLLLGILYFFKILPSYRIINIPMFFLFLIFLLYYLFMHNLIFINLIKTSQDIQFNTKHIYTHTILFILILFFLKHAKIVNSLILYFFIFKLNFINIFVLIFFKYLLLVNFFKKNLILKLIHIFCILFFFATQQQIYIFYLEVIETITNYVEVIKISNISLKIRSYSTGITGFNNLNLITYMSQDVYSCRFDFLSGLEKNIFEKNILFTTNNLVELYSYNFQKLIQVSGFNIFIFLCLVGILVFLFLKEKKNIHI